MDFRTKATLGWVLVFLSFLLCTSSRWSQTHTRQGVGELRRGSNQETKLGARGVVYPRVGRDEGVDERRRDGPTAQAVADGRRLERRERVGLGAT